MIKWYEDNKIKIEFDEVPYVSVRVAVPSMSNAEKKAIKKYPFINKRSLKVEITYQEKIYGFTIPKNYCWNGSDIPRIFWRLVGAKSEPQYLVASCLHDYTLENKSIINYNRRLTTEIFRGCLMEAGVGKIKAQIMAECVDLFQHFCDWGLEYNK